MTYCYGLASVVNRRPSSVVRRPLTSSQELLGQSLTNLEFCLKFKVLLKENEGKRDLIILNVHLIQAEVLYSNSGMILQL